MSMRYSLRHGRRESAGSKGIVGKRDDDGRRQTQTRENQNKLELGLRDKSRAAQDAPSTRAA